LIKVLSDNAANENILFRNASIETLGFVCEEIAPEDLPKELCSLIIQGLTRNISADPALSETTALAIKALYLALPFASPNFEVAHERDYIMARIFEAFQCQDEDTRVVAMQILVDVGRQEYDSVEFYFSKICEVTSTLARNDDEKVGAQAIEFWTSLAEEEQSRNLKRMSHKGYIPQCCH
jgi:importin subunit beta-1